MLPSSVSARTVSKSIGEAGGNRKQRERLADHIQYTNIFALSEAIAMHFARIFLPFLCIPIAALLALPRTCRAQQKTLANNDFRLTYSSSGVTGIQGVHDT